MWSYRKIPFFSFEAGNVNSRTDNRLLLGWMEIVLTAKEMKNILRYSAFTCRRNRIRHYYPFMFPVTWLFVWIVWLGKKWVDLGSDQTEKMNSYLYFLFLFFGSWQTSIKLKIAPNQIKRGDDVYIPFFRLPKLTRSVGRIACKLKAFSESHRWLNKTSIPFAQLRNKFSRLLQFIIRIAEFLFTVCERVRFLCVRKTQEYLIFCRFLDRQKDP